MHLKSTSLLLPLLIFAIYIQAQNSALDFDGSNDIVRGPSSSIFELSSGTVELWIKPNYKSGRQTFIGYRDNTGFQTRYLWNFTEGLSGLGFWNGSSYATIGFPFTAGEWYHLAVVDDNVNTKIYVNGVGIGAFPTQIGDAGGSDLHLILGVDIPLDEYLDGILDEVRIWNYPRTAAEIAETFDRNLQGFEPGLISYWKFEEGSGDLTYDQVSTGSGLLGDGSSDAKPTWVSTDLILNDPLCVGDGMDRDGDGVCADLDCNDNNPKISTGVGLNCDDGDPQTHNDKINDQCKCEGSSILCDFSASKNPSIKIKNLSINGTKIKSHKGIAPLQGLTSISYFGEYPATELDPIYASISIDQDLDGTFDYEFLTLYVPDPDPLSPTAGQVFNSGNIDLPPLDQGLLRLMMKKGDPTAPCGDLGNADVEDFYIGVSAKEKCLNLVQRVRALQNAPGEVISVFPNPSPGHFYIKINQPTTDFSEITLCNATGLLVFHKAYQGSPERQFDFSHLQDGYYIIKTKLDNSVHTNKVLILK